MNDSEKKFHPEQTATSEESIPPQSISLDQLKTRMRRREFLESLFMFSTVSGVLGGMGLSFLPDLKIPVSETPIPPDLFVEHDSVQIDNTHFLPVGVAHTEHTYLRHKEQIKKIISQAQSVNLEYFKPDARDLSARWLNNDIEILADYYPTKQATNFFAAVASVAAQQNKEVFVVNPQTDANSILEAWIALGFTSDVALHQFPVLIEKLAKKKLSRRSFLRLAPAIPGLIVLNGWKQTMDRVSSTFELDSESQEDNTFLTWTLLDYRDVTSSLGLIAWHEEHGSISGKVPMFYGEGHFTPGMRYYLQNPDKAREKANFYLHHNIVSDRTIRSYVFENNQWQEKPATRY